MPGLSQLKKFNSDILLLGNEPSLRSQRGEHPLTVPIPQTVKDIDDSEDFVIGMPISIKENTVENTEIENEDFSDIIGSQTTSSSSSQVQADNNAVVPDFSDILSSTVEISEDESMPDLSMFMETVEPTQEEEITEEQEEVSIADLDLDALLGAEGFADSEESEEVIEENLEELTEKITESVEDSSIKEPIVEDILQYEEPSVENINITKEKVSDIPLETESFVEPNAELINEVLDNPIEDIPSFSDPVINEGLNDIQSEDSLENNNDFSSAESGLLDNFESLSDFNLDNLEGLENLDTDLNNNLDNIENIQSVESFDSIDNLENTENLESANNLENIENFDSINDLSNFDNDNNIDTNLDSFDNNLDSLNDFNSIDTNLDDLSSLTNNEELNNLSNEELIQEDFVINNSFNNDNLDLNNVNLDELPDFNEESSLSAENNDFESSILNDDNFGMDSDFNFEDSNFQDNQNNFEQDAPLEQFDTSELEGLDFEIPDTDSQLSNDASSDFELGSSDDFSTEGSDFEIPGFSDVQTAETGKDGKFKQKIVKEENDNLNQDSKNSLTDEEYQKFLKNLLIYPLNVRIAVEELIVKNEFTDEAELDIIKKVIKKVPARQLASELEKMLDITILVPRDFERRTAEEYEAYKASFQYQLRNKIIPGAILGIAVAFLCFVFVIFTKNFIYNPLRANSLYKQGYALIEQGEYPQSEIKFNQAAKYKLLKNWFFKYANAYREKKQYIRAEQIYKAILHFFKQDKVAGLEYANMELNDLANYSRAEEIVLREVLDYYINDKEGILLLGDIYLEWATEKDSSKFDLAKERYSELIQLYGENNLYLSRMMRYFARTDNLLEVLRLKEIFIPKEKSLSSQDWTELSGFLLDKLYGYLPPSEEYLREKIEDVKKLLLRAVKLDKTNPTAYYNLSRYYVNTNNSVYAKKTLEDAINAYNDSNIQKKKDLYNYIDSYRLLGEEYIKEKEYLKAQESFTYGINNYYNAKNNSGLEGTSNIGKLFADMGDVNYFIMGDYNSALQNYMDSVDNFNDIPEIRYKIGYIQYGKNNYESALGSFMKASEVSSDDKNLLLATANTLSLKNDDYAALGYYEKLADILNDQYLQKGVTLPQVRKDDAELIDLFLKTSNNLGVTFHKLAQRTGNSNFNANAIVKFQESIRAWDAMTRNQQTMVRMEGSNLAEQNIKYVTNRFASYKPAIYTDIPKVMDSDQGLLK